MTNTAQSGRRFAKGKTLRARATANAAPPFLARPAVECLEERRLFALTVGPYFPSTTPAATLANSLLLANAGINVTGATFVGVDGQAGTYAGFDIRSGQTRLAISDGVILTSGTAQGALGPNGNFPDLAQAPDESTDVGFQDALDGDPDLDALVGIDTHDANSLTITFTADASVQSILFDFIFGSEEFPDFVGSFNDAFAAYLDGQQISFDIDGNPVTVNNNFFQLNNSGVTADQDPDVAGKIGVSLPLEYDGLTPVIRTQAPLNTALTTHTLKFVIADAFDSSLDSGVFISRFQGSSQVISGPITDLPQPGVLRFDTPIYTKVENELFATVTILREGGASGLVTADIFSSDGTATAGLDYTPFPLTTVTFQDGQTSQTITVPIVDDSIAEGDETFTLTLANPTNGLGLSETNSQATVRIIDNELGVQFLTPIFTLAEGLTPVKATITVVLTGPAATPVTVDFATIAGGSATANVDYTPVSGTLTFAPGVTSQTFEIPITEDFIVETLETVNLALSNVNAPFLIGLNNPAVLQIQDLDRPPAVLDAQFVTNERFLNGIAIRYSEAMEEGPAEDPKNYDIFLRKESKKLGGSATRTRMDIVSAVYEPNSRTVTLTTKKALRENKVYEVVANTTRAEGLESVQGDRLDGNYDNIQGDDFTGYVARATKISYFDKQGDLINLQLKGPGRMELFRNVEREARVLRMLETSRDTILTGSVSPQTSISDGQGIIETVLIGTGFRNQLPMPPFVIRESFDGLQKPNT